MLQHQQSIEQISQGDFDPRGQYTEVIDAVKQVSSGGGSSSGGDCKEVGFYKAVLDHSRIQYLVLGLDAENCRLVGLVALAIES